MPNIEVVSSVICMIFILSYIISILTNFIFVFIKEKYIVIIIQKLQEKIFVVSFCLFILSFFTIYILSYFYEYFNINYFAVKIDDLSLWIYSIFAYLCLLALLVVLKIEYAIYNVLKNTIEDSKEVNENKYCKDCDGEYNCELIHTKICHLNKHSYAE